MREAVHDWLEGLEVRSDRAYALRYDYTNELGGGQEHYYLFYVPAGGRSPSKSFGTESGLFGTTLELRLERTHNGTTRRAVRLHITPHKPVPRRMITHGTI